MSVSRMYHCNNGWWEVFVVVVVGICNACDRAINESGIKLAANDSLSSDLEKD